MKFAEMEAVISYIQEHLYDPLSLGQLAAYAAYSPYHFTRIFKAYTGLTPQYYISSLRLQRAKDLLLQTNLSVRDISLEIGQQSLGTFTTRFTQRVGMTPSEFRNSPLKADNNMALLKKSTHWASALLPRAGEGVVKGTVTTAVPSSGGVTLIGLFDKPIPEGIPRWGTLIAGTGDFQLNSVQPGTYYLMATCISWEMRAVDALLPYATLRTRSRKPVIVRPAEPVPHQQVVLYPPQIDDPPILISLPLLMERFINRMRQNNHFL
ncbi:helix-turn-helix transcriptional regulator [Paenibacillus tarimensis]|uniref:helix-turn-helix transcriptional regulator n=1 Tax=Paenibacillus tarimensis TaxID=416012 RepID=UPI001F263E54|nr:AraC family transcriptional regulator [Paenibacillus tarimensis]MCF2945263.1 AraC family transcriptional regulator [Paenibacillus tarimensis]